MQNNTFSGLIVGQNLLTLKEVDSTNTFLKNMLANNEPVPEGTVIMAESQVAGRGQQQNKWYSSVGESLTFSILLKPEFIPVSQQFILTCTISLGIYDALQTLVGAQLKIKWPNDIFIGNCKLGGILIENQVQGKVIRNSIIGIGLNINQSEFPHWVSNAVSLKQMLHTDYDLKTLLLEICRHIQYWYIKLKDGNYSQIQAAYLKALYRLNIQGRFKAQDIIFEGIITGINLTGQLLVKNNEVLVAYNLKEIEFLNN
ncbi:biotin--[acetyl-CoA-carboxylase] ligase [Mucilaginibacter terrae]|uniref:biotin--[acetyl-CoA-carboxylase] ligase n=1 Tax=Mucilaginibacter terrae TaxID=1955052 RepID=UPI00363270D1